jgi:succinate-semialdehyde dehydrogenase/glutarate-semialdehyde dehydrogenase
MTDYAVVDPRTGDTLKQYPTISDAELQQAIAKADKAHSGRPPRRWPSAPSSSAA